MTYFSSQNRSSATDSAKAAGTAVSVTSSSTEIVVANKARAELFLFNTHATSRVSLSLGGTAVDNNGIVLLAQTGVVLSSFLGAVNGIANTGTVSVAVSEA